MKKLMVPGSAIYYPASDNTSFRVGVVGADGKTIFNLYQDFRMPAPGEDDLIVSPSELKSFLVTYVAALKESEDYQQADSDVQWLVTMYEQTSYFSPKSTPENVEIFNRVAAEYDSAHRPLFYEYFFGMPEN